MALVAIAGTVLVSETGIRLESTSLKASIVVVPVVLVGVADRGVAMGWMCLWRGVTR